MLTGCSPISTRNTIAFFSHPLKRFSIVPNTLFQVDYRVRNLGRISFTQAFLRSLAIRPFVGATVARANLLRSHRPAYRSDSAGLWPERLTFAAPSGLLSALHDLLPSPSRTAER
jgi:hypothetical protein